MEPGLSGSPGNGFQRPGAVAIALARARRRFSDASDLTWSERFSQWVAVERNARRPFLWLAPGMGLGAALYYSADVEPSLYAPLSLLALSAVAALSCRKGHRGLFSFFLFIAAISAGFLSGCLRTVSVSAPILKEMRIGRLEGVIEEIDWRQQGARIIVRPDRIQGLRERDLPARVRVTLTGRPAIVAGARISATARLLPPPTPVMPGGYDFARDAFFKGIGGVGSLVGRIEMLPATPLSVPFQFQVTVDNFRNALTLRIIETVGGQSGAVAAALVTGKRGMISEETNDALRAAGIYHVVSISGLHMAIAAGLVFWTVRLFFVLIPGLALRHPVKKWAAVAAMLGATAYNIFAGSDVATERSLLMTLVFFGAMIVERRVLSMRNWAVAAIILIALEPNAVFSPGFQMSFAAVAALVALYERQPKPGDANEMPEPKTAKGPRPGFIRRGWQGFVKAVRDVMLTTLAAEAATAPFALYHFHMAQSFGLVGNAITLPFVSFVVMPAAFLGVIALPFGLDGPIWSVMGYGVDGVLQASHMIASWPSATRIFPAFGIGALVLLVLGLLLLTLWITPIRFAGLAFVGLGVGAAVMTRQPDVLVSREATLMAVRGADGRLVVAGRSLNSFTLTQWLRADGDNRPIDQDLRKGAVCDRKGCVITRPDGRRVVLAYDADTVADACKTEAVLVTNRTANRDCRAFTIDRDVIERKGAVALLRESNGELRLIADHTTTRDRPWAPRKWRGDERDVDGTRPAKATAPSNSLAPPDPDAAE